MLMKQLPSAPQLHLWWKIKRVEPRKEDVLREHAFRAMQTRTFRPVLIPQQLPWQLGGPLGIGLSNRC